MEHTSDPEPVSLIASAPMCSPEWAAGPRVGAGRNEAAGPRPRAGKVVQGMAD